eukprot:1522856-Pyramimonas_sp.AAC.1
MAYSCLAVKGSFAEVAFLYSCSRAFISRWCTWCLVGFGSLPLGMPTKASRVCSCQRLTPD